MLSNVPILLLMRILFTIERTLLAWCCGGSWDRMERSLPIYRSWKDWWGKHPARSVLEVGGSEAAAVIIRCDHLWLVMTPCSLHTGLVYIISPVSITVAFTQQDEADQPQPQPPSCSLLVSPADWTMCSAQGRAADWEAENTCGRGAVRPGPAVPPPPSTSLTSHHNSLSLSVPACCLPVSRPARPG